MRIFETHYIRKYKTLNGLWNFKKENGEEYLMPVPGCWEDNPNMLTYRGKGTYYKNIKIEKKENICYNEITKKEVQSNETLKILTFI